MEWVTAAEAADITGLTRQYIHNLAPRFKSTHRLGGFLVFKRAEIEKFRDSRTSNPQS